jgi:ribosomal protein S18 acetylase RimI-like enzyme
MGNELKIRKGHTSDTQVVLKIARTLDDWFSENGIKYIKQDLEFQRLLLAEANSLPIGFLSFFIYEGVGYLGRIGVYEHYHGSNAAEMLFKEFERIMKDSEINVLQVKTLGESVDYPPYDRSRNYYRKMGFEKYRSEMTDNPECPEELILRKKI